ncbi:MAG: ElyC/SanA/YdcF family protein [Candidatus Omnitrophica bacterium]|nr:ElyC/SanA/YdcF family protein [Candidatus Omnitrophota bacterium]
MLKGENIICISSIDWDFIWQGHQEIMSTFANNGNKVLFIENTGVRSPGIKDIYRLKKRFGDYFKGIKGIRKVAEGLYVYSPIVLPFPYSRIARQINKRILLAVINRWMKVMGFSNPIIWTYLPTGTALDIINNVGKKILVYYCVADFFELAGSSKAVKKAEDELIRKSDVVFAQGRVLEEKCRPLNENVSIFPPGVKIEAFENFRPSADTVPSDLKKISGTIVGYVGGVHKHIDFGLLRYIAEAHPEWSLVLVGPVQADIREIGGLKNIHLLGKKDFSELPYYINGFDVCIIPYLNTEYTATVYPTKLNEYHALGKPVVSTDLPEILNFNRENGGIVSIGKDKSEFAEQVSLSVGEKDSALADKRILSARKNSWAARIERMSGLIEETIEKKSRSPYDWHKNFLALYKTSGRIVKAALVVLAAYLFIFYTPVVWFMAEPLKITDTPRKADAIVVFAGGVGESGEAGQGYLERVEYAVELYKAGFAKNIVFSSGYMYIFKEPLVMKALAVSLGVPAEAIMLEDRARNTYENVKFSEKILQDKKWDSILLVSSPYHMRRVSMVFKKTGEKIEVAYTPIPQSSFYSHKTANYYSGGNWKQIDLRQIEGILREYSAIAYYWWKGYI